MSDRYQNQELEHLPWFQKELIQAGVTFALENGLFDQLNNLYHAIPEGECGGCADCCMESVETHWIEFLQVYHYLQDRPELLKQILPRLIRFYLLEGVEKSHCPFQLDDRRCAIYPVRPTPCRLFGQWNEEDYEENYQLTQEGNLGVANHYQEYYQIQLPEAVIEHKVPFCHTFQKPQDFTRDDFYDHLEGIMVLQSRLLLADLIDEGMMTLGLVSWWMGFWFDLDELQDLKVDLMKRYLAEGESGVKEELLTLLQQTSG